MTIEWDKITWFSKLLAVGLFVAVSGIGLLLGGALQWVDDDVRNAQGGVANRVSQPKPGLRSYTNPQYQFQLSFPDTLFLAERHEGSYFTLVLTDPTSENAYEYNYPPSEPFASVEGPTAYDLTIRPTEYKTVQELVERAYKDREGDERPVVTYTTFAGVQAVKVNDPISFGGCLGSDIFLIRHGYEYRLPNHGCFAGLAAQVNVSFAFTAELSPLEGWQTYSDAPNNFSIAYPASFKVDPGDRGVTFSSPDNSVYYLEVAIENPISPTDDVVAWADADNWPFPDGWRNHYSVITVGGHSALSATDIGLVIVKVGNRVFYIHNGILGPGDYATPPVSSEVFDFAVASFEAWF